MTKWRPADPQPTPPFKEGTRVELGERHGPDETEPHVRPGEHATIECESGQDHYTLKLVQGGRFHICTIADFIVLEPVADTLSPDYRGPRTIPRMLYELRSAIRSHTEGALMDAESLIQEIADVLGIERLEPSTDSEEQDET